MNLFLCLFLLRFPYNNIILRKFLRLKDILKDVGVIHLKGQILPNQVKCILISTLKVGIELYIVFLERFY